MGIFGLGREPIEDLESEMEISHVRASTYNDSLDELRRAVGARDQTLLEADERIIELEQEVISLQDQLSEASLALTIAEAEAQHKSAKLEDAKKWAKKADEVFAEQEKTIKTQQTELENGRKVIDELSEEIKQEQLRTKYWKDSTERERKRSSKRAEIVSDLIEALKTGAALSIDFPKKLEEAGIKVKGR